MDQPDGIPGGPGGRMVDRARVRATARRGALFGVGVAAAFLAIALYGALTQGPPPLTTKDVEAGIDKALASMTPPPAFSQVVYDEVRPSVVLIQVTGGAGRPPSSSRRHSRRIRAGSPRDCPGSPDIRPPAVN